MTRRPLAGISLVVLAVAVVALGATASSADPGDGPEPPPRGSGGAVTVAVVDTGVDPALSLGGQLDHGAGRSVVPGEPLVDHDGHGTAMASVVHANAPHARLVVIKASGGDGTSDVRMAEAVDHALAVDAQVVLIAMAGPEALPSTQSAIERARRAGALVVVAAGNDGVDLDVRPRYPAALGAPGVVAVAAVEADGRLLASSNRGAGASVSGLGRGVPACGLGSTPTTVGGTSAAAALVAARAARLVAADEDGMSLSELRALLEEAPALEAADARCS